MSNNNILLLAIPLLLVGCTGSTRPAHPSSAPAPMVHQSSMGSVHSHWQVVEMPREFVGHWRLQFSADQPPRTRLRPEYAALVFHLAQSPADCRVLLDEPDGLRPIGTMPYLFMEGDQMVAVFTGDFHLSYALQLRQTSSGDIVGIFEHAGSGAVFFSDDVLLVKL